MEAKIKDNMAEGGGEKHQVLPQNNSSAKNAQHYPFHSEAGGERVEEHDEIEQEFTRHFRQVHQEPQKDRRQAIKK